MRSLVRNSVRNAPAINTIMAAAMIVGVMAMSLLRRETFPEFQLELCLVSVPYPGASPSEVEESICQKIEEAIQGVDGIKKIESRASEGVGSVVAFLNADVKDPQKILNEIRGEVDRIPSFPENAEDPEIRQITLTAPAIRLAFIAPAMSLEEATSEAFERKLRDQTETIRDELLALPSISRVQIVAAKNYQIDVEISEANLRKYGLTLEQLANIIAKENLDLPAGTLRAQATDYLVRGANKRDTGDRIAELPLLTQSNGSVIRVRDLGTVRDGFEDVPSRNWINRRPGMSMVVQKAPNEDVIQIAKEVKAYVQQKRTELPTGYELHVWADTSTVVADRLNMLFKNGIQGLVLVFLLLALFLELRLAFWVSMGIPFSLLGTCLVMLYFGATMNMISMFAFLMVLGIVVDDAIVVGENIHTHRMMGKPRFAAAVDGTVEIVPAVTSSVLTTVVAFLPMFFISGVLGKFISVMPLAIVAALIISLLESVFILPCHLGHGEPSKTPWSQVIWTQTWTIFYQLPILFRFTLGVVVLALGFVVSSLLVPLEQVGQLFAGVLHWANHHVTSTLDLFVEFYLRPIVRWAIEAPFTIVTSGLALLLFSFGLVTGGYTPFKMFPKIDGNNIIANVTFPDGTPYHITDAATKQIEEAIYRLHERYEAQGKPILQLSSRSVGQILGDNAAQGDSSGANVGQIVLELVDTAVRGVHSDEILSAWREETGSIAGVEELRFQMAEIGPGGRDIEFRLLGDDLNKLEMAVERVKEHLSQFSGVSDVADDARPGKFEPQLSVREDAEALGITNGDLFRTVRASLFGQEVMRLQRGRHEVKLMVRYPKDERKSLANLEEIRVRFPDGAEVPLPEVARIDTKQGYTQINRVDQKRSVTITASVDSNKGNSHEIVTNLKTAFLPDLLQEYPGISVRWEGEAEQTSESMQSLLVGFVVAMFVMFILLAFQFRSYFQPIIVLLIIPFGMVGAILGHLVMGLNLTMFSMFGMVALAGVVVNDSIVLIDFINQRRLDGLSLKEALQDACLRRFRPVLLTSTTTVAGLAPLLMERSLQAQVVVPMAVSLSFGLALTTLWVIFLVPALYLWYGQTLGQTIVGQELEPGDDGTGTGILADGESVASENHASANPIVRELYRD